jgi:hypothetical protein
MRPFDACRYRIKWGVSHGKNMSQLWGETSADDLYAPSAKVDADGNGVIMLNQVQPFPVNISLELGEFLYQLRATLDGAIYQANIFQTGQDPPTNEKDLEFPIFDDPKIYAKNAPSMIGPLSDECKRIIEQVQPYHAKDIPPDELPTAKSRCLYILNDWARIDRHRRLHVVGASASTPGPLIRIPEGVILASMTHTPFRFLENENVIATFKLTGYSHGMKVEMNPQIRADIAVNEPPPPCAATDTLESRLTAIAVTVYDIVTDLENCF